MIREITLVLEIITLIVIKLADVSLYNNIHGRLQSLRNQIIAI